MSDFLSVAQSIAYQAGAILREGYKLEKDVQYKDINDLVTNVDLQSESFIVARLRENFPDHGILAEEKGIIEASSEYQWMVDPLDGTTNFVHGIPIFAVSICLLRDNKPIVGVVYDPILDELYSAELGQGATLNNRAIKVSGISDLAKALLATGFPADAYRNPRNNLNQFSKFNFHVQAVRRAGSAALDCAWVARGGFDGYWEFGIKPWDVCAGALIALEAGGKYTTIEGKEYDTSCDTILVSNGLLHNQMLNILGEENDLTSS